MSFETALLPAQSPKPHRDPSPTTRHRTIRVRRACQAQAKKSGTARSFLGIDGSEAGCWTLVRLENGIIGRPENFSDNPAGLSALMCFIIEDCWRPKVCLRLGSGPVSKLLGLVGAIPDVEVVLMSEQGLGLYRSWMPTRNPNDEDTAGCALLLARCAEHII